VTPEKQNQGATAVGSGDWLGSMVMVWNSGLKSTLKQNDQTGKSSENDPIKKIMVGKRVKWCGSNGGDDARLRF